MLRKGRLTLTGGLAALLVGAMVALPLPSGVAAQVEPIGDVAAQQPGGGSLLPLAEARAIIDGATGFTRARGQAMSIAVLDVGGRLISQDRMDGASFNSVQFAQGKAMAALMLRIPTAETFDWAYNQPDRWFGIQIMFPGQVYLGPGGVPLRFNGQLVGSAGVSGLPRGEDDEALEAGLEAWARMRPGAGH